MNCTFIKALLLTLLSLGYNNSVCQDNKANDSVVQNKIVFPVPAYIDCPRIMNARSQVNAMNDNEVKHKIMKILNDKEYGIIDNNGKTYYNKIDNAILMKYLLLRLIAKNWGADTKLQEKETTRLYQELNPNFTNDIKLLIRHISTMFTGMQYKDLGNNTMESMLEVLLNNEILVSSLFSDASWVGINMPTTKINSLLFLQTFIMRYIDIAGEYGPNMANKKFANILDKKQAPVNNIEQLSDQLFNLDISKYFYLPSYDSKGQSTMANNIIKEILSDKQAVKDFNTARDALNLDQLKQCCDIIVLTINELIKDKISKQSINTVKPN